MTDLSEQPANRLTQTTSVRLFLLSLVPGAAGPIKMALSDELWRGKARTEGTVFTELGIGKPFALLTLTAPLKTLKTPTATSVPTVPSSFEAV